MDLKGIVWNSGIVFTSEVPVCGSTCGKRSSRDKYSSLNYTEVALSTLAVVYRCVNITKQNGNETLQVSLTKKKKNGHAWWLQRENLLSSWLVCSHWEKVFNMFSFRIFPIRTTFIQLSSKFSLTSQFESHCLSLKCGLETMWNSLILPLKLNNLNTILPKCKPLPCRNAKHSVISKEATKKLLVRNK